MIIDLLNAGRHYAGTEANILFRLQEMKLSVPSFFCLTEDFTEDELNNYLQNHFQYTTHFTVRLSISNENTAGEELSVSEHEPPFYIKVPKSMIARYAVRLFEEARDYAEKMYSGISDKISAHVLVQEMIKSTVFGCIQTACKNGALNETMITIGEGHNSDFEERGVPFSIYCHNDTDNILFAYEPDNAVVASNYVIQELLRCSEAIKSRFKNCNLSVKFVANYETEKVYFISVQEIGETVHSPDEEIILDTKGVCNYYPGVTEPLHASIAMELSKRIMSFAFRKNGHDYSSSSSLIDQLAYVNGRLYFNVKRLEALQEILFFHKDAEEFVNRSVRLFIRYIFKEQGIVEWYKKRSVAVRVNKLLEENLKYGKKICGRLEVSFANILAAGSKTSPTDQYIHSVFDDIISSLSDCMCANLFNTLYINMNRELLSRHKPGERKYVSASEKIEAALVLRKKLREYHNAFYTKLNEYGLMTGEAFKKLGMFRYKEDIFLLTYKETLALKKGELDNVNELIEKRRREFEWYRSLPGFTHLVFSKEITDAPVGKVSFVRSLKEKCYIRGSGLVSGKTRLPAVACDENHLPDCCDNKHIYVMQYLPDNIDQYTVGGIVIEHPDVFANLDPEIESCGYPIVCGAEHCCALAETGSFIEIDGAAGEVCIIRTENSGK